MPNYTYPDVDPLIAAVKNKFSVTDHDTLEALETDFVVARDRELLHGHGPTGTLDAAHLKAIHRHLFQDVYEWAGRTRDEKVRLSDGTIATEPIIRKAGGKPFMLGARIPGALKAISDRLRKANYLRGLSRDEFATQAADIMAAINAIHAFREGNGRTQRAFIRALAKAAGHTLDFTVISQERMIQASIAANEREDPSIMRRLFADATNPARIAALRRVIAFFVRQEYRWNDHYVATLDPGHAVELTMAGSAGDQFMARTGAEILIGQTSDLPSPMPARGEVFVYEGHTPWA